MTRSPPITFEDMQQTTPNHWKAIDRAKMRKLGPTPFWKRLASAKQMRATRDGKLGERRDVRGAGADGGRSIFCLASVEQLGRLAGIQSGPSSAPRNFIVAWAGLLKAKDNRCSNSEILLVH